MSATDDVSTRSRVSAGKLLCAVVAVLLGLLGVTAVSAQEQTPTTTVPPTPTTVPPTTTTVPPGQPAPSLTVTAFTRNSATLTLANHTDKWWLKRTGPTVGECVSKGSASTGSSANTENLTSLTSGTTYTYRAYKDKSGKCHWSSRIASVSFAIPGMVFSNSKLIVPEAGTAAYTIALSTVPASPVTVTLTTSGDTDISANQSTLIFTSADWAVPQTVTLTAADETDSTDKAYGTTTITHTTTGGNYYDGITADLIATEGDNDVCQGTAAVSNAVDASLVDDCNTLLAAKGAMLTGDLVDDWKTSKSIATWRGVTITDNRVTDIGMTSSRLTGIIPNTFGNLTELTELWLDGNDLSGTIPPQLGNLTKLTHLDLRSNNLSGWIPDQLDKLTKLKYLDLAGNNLSGSISVELDKLTKLTYLSLSGNNLSGPIPPTLGEHTDITHLSMAVNLLSGSIPDTLGNLGNLTHLALLGNDLSGSIPASFNKLGALTYLALNNNSLSGCVPPTLTRFVVGDLYINPQKNGERLELCAGIVAPAQVTVSEESTETYIVGLTTTEPTASVTVTITTSGDSDITVDTTDDIDGNQNTLTFTLADWNFPQTVTLTAAKDDDSINGTTTITHTTSSTDNDYNNLTATTTATEAEPADEVEP